MYNGIGLQSTRGTGTSGHVQRNVAALHRTHRRRTSNPNPNQRLRAALLRKSGHAQRAHAARRRVEVAVAELEEELNARGYDEDTIVSMAQRLREDLLSRGEDEGRGERDRELEKGRGGTELLDHRNEKLRNVLRVQEGYVEGSGFRNIRQREEKVDADDQEPKIGPLKQTSLKDSASPDVAEKDTLKPAEPENIPRTDVNGGPRNVEDAPSDAESSSLSESSDESDRDDVPEVQDKADEVDIERDIPSRRKAPFPEIDEVNEVDEADRKRVHLTEPTTREPRKRDTLSPALSPSLSREDRTAVRSSPLRRTEYGRRSRSASPSPRSEERGRESPYRRERSPRYRDPSPYSREASPRRYDPPPYDRTPTPRKHSRDRSPYDRNPTPHNYHMYGISPYDHQRSRYHRSDRQRRSPYRSRSPSRTRSRSRSRSFSRRRYRRYRDESSDSLSASSRSASPYGRRPSSPYGRSPSPRRRLSPYGRRSPRRRAYSPYSRKRGYSGYTPPRRVRRRGRSSDGYRYRRRSERRERNRGYSSSDKDSGSPSRYRTPLRRSRFGDYRSPRAPAISPRPTRRYSASPAD